MKPPSTESVRRQANRSVIKAASKINPHTRLVSSITSMFSADNWGAKTKDYIKSIEKMRDGSLEQIVQLTAPYLSTSKNHCGELSHSLLAPAEGVRACLEDDWYASM